MRDMDFEFRERKDSQTKVDGAAHEAEMEAYWNQRTVGARREDNRNYGGLGGGRSNFARETSSVCYSCNQPGHLARNCEHRVSKCNFCGKIGHLEAACLTMRKVSQPKGDQQRRQDDERGQGGNYQQQRRQEDDRGQGSN